MACLRCTLCRASIFCRALLALAVGRGAVALVSCGIALERLAEAVAWMGARRFMPDGGLAAVPATAVAAADRVDAAGAPSAAFAKPDSAFPTDLKVAKDDNSLETRSGCAASAGGWADGPAAAPTAPARPRTVCNVSGKRNLKGLLQKVIFNI